MKRRSLGRKESEKNIYNKILMLTELILFLLVLVFTNDIISKNVSGRVVPILCLLMMFNAIIGFRLNKKQES